MVVAISTSDVTETTELQKFFFTEAFAHFAVKPALLFAVQSYKATPNKGDIYVK